jgi:hypothetical protein
MRTRDEDLDWPSNCDYSAFAQAYIPCMEKAWFEMKDEIRRRFADAVWIPLRMWGSRTTREYGVLGYSNELNAVRSMAIPNAKRKEGEKITWLDTNYSSSVYAYAEGYKPADIYQHNTGEDFGIDLVLVQGFGGMEPSVWHLHQDLVIALGLLREGDAWVCPSEGFIEVVRSTRDPDGETNSITIRAEFLRDYLAARSLALRMTTYRSRDEIMEDCGHIGWSQDGHREEVGGGRFEGRAWDIHEGGQPFGSKTGVFHISRTDIDPESDVPTMGRATDDNTRSASWTTKAEGRKLCRVMGEFWRDEWIEPAASSPRIRGDRVVSTVSFAVNANGDRASADELDDEDVGRWLWFSPQLAPAILARRGSSLKWFTKQTGSIECIPGYGVHFGLNESDLVTAYAHDVARLPEWQRRVWAGFNVTPDGGVCRELLSAHAEARPAHTRAPEGFLGQGLEAIDAAFVALWARPLIREHAATREILKSIHRFRAIDEAGLLALAKDLARLTADSFDVELLHSIAPPEKGKKPGSLKSLETVIAAFIGADRAHELIGPLVGIYELRLGDAHLPSGKIDEARALARLDVGASTLKQGFQLIHIAVSVLFEIAIILESGVPRQTATDPG